MKHWGGESLAIKKDNFLVECHMLEQFVREVKINLKNQEKIAPNSS